LDGINENPSGEAIENLEGPACFPTRKAKTKRTDTPLAPILVDTQHSDVSPIRGIAMQALFAHDHSNGYVTRLGGICLLGRKLVFPELWASDDVQGMTGVAYPMGELQ
jgi:hypothetical protein